MQLLFLVLLVVMTLLPGLAEIFLRDLPEGETLHPPVAPARPPVAEAVVPPPPVREAPDPQVVGSLWTPGETTECQVCGVALRDRLVACPACATPHHAACWDYALGCSTYACDSRRV